MAANTTCNETVEQIRRVSYQNQYPKNEACSSNSIENIRQNHCTKKYRSLTYIYICRSNLTSQWINSFSQTFLHQNTFKICQNHWTTKYRSLTHIHFMWLTFCITWIQYSNYDSCLSNSLQDIRQNHWTIKYMSLAYILYSFSSMFVSHWINISSTTLIHQIVFKI